MKLKSPAWFVSKETFWISLFFVTSIGIRALIPPAPDYGAFHDDSLMVRLAHQILQTGWIGPWDELTINTFAKGIGFPLYLAANHLFPWPPTVTNQFLLLTGGLVALFELQKLGLPRKSVPVWFGIYAFFPVWYGDQFSRIYREGLLTPLTVIIFALALICRRLLNDYLNHNFVGYLKTKLVMASVVLGLFIGYFYITKVSWHFLAVLALLVLLTSFITLPKGQTIRKLLALTLVIGVTGIGAIAIPYMTATKNQQILGVKIIEDFGSGSFSDAVTIMMSVEPKTKQTYLDIDEAMRKQMYKVSPTLSKLKPYLELPPGQGWSTFSCQEFNICDESALWFTWELRDAVMHAGLANDATSFENTFSQIAAEIGAGCSTGVIKCGQKGIAPGLDNLSTISPRLLVDSYSNGINHLLNLSATGVSRNKVEGSPEIVEIWESTINGLPAAYQTIEKYNPNGHYIAGFIMVLENIYKALWIPLLVAAASGLLLSTNKRPSQEKALRAIGIASIAAISILVLQLSLIDVDGGLILNRAGVLYLLPVYPLLLIGSFVGITLLFRRINLKVK